MDELRYQLQDLFREGLPTGQELAGAVTNKLIGKYDHYLPVELQDLNFASSALDMEGARNILQRVCGESFELLSSAPAALKARAVDPVSDLGFGAKGPLQALTTNQKLAGPILAKPCSGLNSGIHLSIQ